MKKDMRLLIVSCAILLAGLGTSVKVDSSVLSAQELKEPTLDAATESLSTILDSETTKGAGAYDRAANLKSFEKVWQTIKDVHWDAKLIGEKWDGVLEEYRPKAENAESLYEARTVVQEMISELEQSHFSVIPASSYEAIHSGTAGQATPGLIVRIIDDEAVITKVVPDSSAAKAGVIPGWTLVSYDGNEVSTLLEKLKKAVDGPTRFETLAGVTLTKGLAGQEGESLDLVMTDADSERKEISIELSEPEGNMATFGNLPPMKVTYESTTLDGNIGYFAFNLFLDPMTIMPAYREAVHDERNSQGLIIDLRGNIGGIGAMTMGMASELSGKKTKLGTMIMKGNSLDFAVHESPNPVKCPIAVLIDEVSISSSEIFAGGLQDIGIARVFGSRSAGQALPATVMKLPNGDGFMFAIADYLTVSGKRLELHGVVPDERIELTKEVLLRDSDPVLSRAIEWIKTREPQKEVLTREVTDE